MTVNEIYRKNHSAQPEIQRLALPADPWTTMKYIETRTGRLKGIVNRRRNNVPDGVISTNRYGSEIIKCQ